MRVTHVITRLIVGGAQENTIASVLGLREKPHLQVRLISGPTSGPEGSLEPSVARFPGLLSIVPELVRPVHPWKDALAYWALRRLFRDERPDIVHTHSGKAGILGRLAASRSGVPLILHTIHGPSFGAFQGVVSNLVFRSAEQWAGRVTTHFVVVANAMRDHYLACGIGRPDQYTRIFSGFELAPFLAAENNRRIRERYGLSPDDFVVGKIARLFALKGHDDLIAVAPELVKRCPRVRFLLVGDGSWRHRLETQIGALGLADRFIFTGLVPPQQVPELVGIMDVLVHLSAREGLARALPQALAAGKPVVTYDCDGAREVCFDGETGFLLRRGDLPQLCDRLLTLAQKPELRQKLSENGRKFVCRHFPVDRMVDELERLYARLWAETSRGHAG